MNISAAALRSAFTGVNTPRFAFLGWVTGGHTVVHWYLALFPFALPFLKEDLNLSSLQVASLTTVFMGVSGGLLLISGYVADTFRRRVRLILVSTIVVLGLAYLTMGSMETYGWALVAAALVGLALALWHPAAMGSLSLKFPDRRGMALSVHGVGASIGDSLGPPVVGALILIPAIDWRMALQFHFVPAALFAVLLWKGVGSVDGPERGDKHAAPPPFRTYLAGVKSIFSSAQAVAVLVSTALANMARLAVLTFLPIYLGETLGFSSFRLGVYLALLYVLGIVSQPVMGLLSDRIGRKAILVPSFGLMALLYLAIAYSGGGVLLAVVIAALGLFFYAILNITQTAVMDVADESVQASTMGVMGITSQPFVLASPILAGFLVDRYDIETAFIYAAAAGALATLVMIPVKFRSVHASVQVGRPVT